MACSIWMEWVSMVGIYIRDDIDIKADWIFIEYWIAEYLFEYIG